MELIDNCGHVFLPDVSRTTATVAVGVHASTRALLFNEIFLIWHGHKSSTERRMVLLPSCSAPAPLAAFFAA